jgi:metal-sulfur cluster biosynthetic enzyme
MTDITEVRNALTEVIDPCSAARGTDLNLVEMGLVRSIEVDGREVTVGLRLTSPACHMVHYLVDEVEDVVGDLPGVDAVSVEADSGLEWRPSMMTDTAIEKREEYLRRLDRNFDVETPVDSYVREG